MSPKETDRVRDADAPRGVEPPGAEHAPTCLCGCAVATYSMVDIAPQTAPELQRRAA